jgi:hypothetical protein
MTINDILRALLILTSIINISYLKYKRYKNVNKKLKYIIRENLILYTTIVFLENILKYDLGIEFKEIFLYFIAIPEFLSNFILPKIYKQDFLKND